MRTWPALELSAVERPLRSTAAAEILGYADKYVGGEGMASAPRELPADLRRRRGRVAARRGPHASCAWPRVRGVARIDFLSDGARPVRERGQHRPGLTGALPVGRAAGSPFIDLLDAMVAEALSAARRHYSAAGADGTVLRSAGGIAAKLA